MKKLFLLVCVVVAFSVPAYFSVEKPVEAPIQVIPSPPVAQGKTFSEARDSITVLSCRAIMDKLCSDEFEGRMSGKRGNKLAFSWAEEKFKKYGLKTSRQRFSIARRNPGPNNERGDDFTENLIGVLEGSSDRYILIFAHLDHLGFGPMASMTPHRIEIYNGADDNGTGSTAVMEIAKAFTSMDIKPSHNIMFILFSGEELGLLGSIFFVRNPTVPLNKISLVINFDMIGTLEGDNVKIFGGSRITGLDVLVRSFVQKYPFRTSMTNSAGGGSDHAPFVNAGVPTIFFHTGSHRFYHTPDDDIGIIDFDGLTWITRFVFQLAYEFDHQKFKKAIFMRGERVPEDLDHGLEKFPTFD